MPGKPPAKSNHAAFACKPQDLYMLNDDLSLRSLLQHSRTIAIVGLSANDSRPSHGVARYLIDHGYTVIPVNPAYPEVLGLTSYASLQDIPVPVDIVDVFRKSEDVLPVAEDAIAIGVRALWLQLGVINAEATLRAQQAGLSVVQDRCIKVEHARLL
jgi:predicted CoA-binding protein